VAHVRPGKIDSGGGGDGDGGGDAVCNDDELPFSLLLRQFMNSVMQSATTAPTTAVIRPPRLLLLPPPGDDFNPFQRPTIVTIVPYQITEIRLSRSNRPL